MGKIDLHSHSIISSDGEFEPEELVRIFAKSGIELMAIADHNSTRAVKRGIREAEKQGIRLIPATELDSEFKGRGYHLLGYGIDYEAPVFREIEENVLRQNLEAAKLMFQKTRELGFDIHESEPEALAKRGGHPGEWTGEIFAEVLLSKPEYNNNPILAPYRTGGSKSDNPFVNFYWDYYSQAKPCYAPVKFPEIAELINTIHQHGGKAVLAHPGQNLPKGDGHDSTLLDIIFLGLDGIEAYSSYHSPEQIALYKKIAREHKLFITCGSDFHGRTKPSVFPGKTGCEDESVSEEILRLFA